MSLGDYKSLQAWKIQQSTIIGDLLRSFAQCHHNKVAFSVIFGFRRHIMMWLVSDKEAFEEKAWTEHHHYHSPPRGRSFDTTMPSNQHVGVIYYLSGVGQLDCLLAPRCYGAPCMQAAADSITLYERHHSSQECNNACWKHAYTDQTMMITDMSSHTGAAGHLCGPLIAPDSP